MDRNNIEDAKEQYEAKKRKTIIMDIPTSERKNVIFALKDISVII